MTTRVDVEDLGDGTIRVTMVHDLDEMRRMLGQIPEVTTEEARRLVRRLDAEIRRAHVDALAAHVAAKAGRKAGKRVRAFAEATARAVERAANAPAPAYHAPPPATMPRFGLVALLART